MKREFQEGLDLGEGVTMPKSVVDAIMAENGRDIEAQKTTGPGGFYALPARCVYVVFLPVTAGWRPSSPPAWPRGSSWASRPAGSRPRR